MRVVFTSHDEAAARVIQVALHEAGIDAHYRTGGWRGRMWRRGARFEEGPVRIEVPAKDVVAARRIVGRVHGTAVQRRTVAQAEEILFRFIAVIGIVVVLGAAIVVLVLAE